MATRTKNSGDTANPRTAKSKKSTRHAKIKPIMALISFLFDLTLTDRTPRGAAFLALQVVGNITQVTTAHRTGIHRSIGSCSVSLALRNSNHASTYRTSRSLCCVRLVTTFPPAAEGPPVIANRTAIRSSAATRYTPIAIRDAGSRSPLLVTIP